MESPRQDENPVPAGQEMATQQPTNETPGAVSLDSPFQVPEPTQPSAATPVGAAERIGALDLLRGFALCGILLMNIVNFAWPGGAYESPTYPFYALESIGNVPDPDIRNKEIADQEKDLTSKEKERNRKEREKEPKDQYAGGDLRWCAVSSEADLYEYSFAHLLVANKMRTLFSMLFGAGIILMADHARGKRNRPWWLHYRRMFWMLMIGAAHGYLLWTGDILFMYAAIGLWIYPLRRVRSRWLFTVGLGLLLTPLAIAWYVPNVIDWVVERGRAVEEKLIAEEKKQAETLNQNQPLKEIEKLPDNPPEEIAPDKGQKDQEATDQAGKSNEEASDKDIPWFDNKLLQGYRGLRSMKGRGPRPEMATLDIRKTRAQGYWDGVVERFNQLKWAHVSFLFIALLGFGWPMVLGMGFMKVGFFTGEWKTPTYGWIALAMYLVGIPMTWWELILSQQGGNTLALQLRLMLPLEWVGSLFLTIANASLLLWLWKTGKLGWLADRLQSAGRMALSNYLFDSLFCSFIFAGWGLAFYGSIPRVGLATLVVSIWAFQLLISPWWLARFRFGPVEWFWRSLTYWRFQPMRLEKAQNPPVSDAPAGISAS